MPSNLSPEKKKKHLSSLFRTPLRVALPASPARVACGSARVARGPTAAGPSPAVHVACGSIARRPRRLLRPSHKQKTRARSIAPRTRSKKRRLLAQENTRRHARLTRSCFGRVVFQQRRPAFTTILFPFSFFTKEKKKTEANSAGSNTSLGLTSFVLTMYAIGPAPSSAETNVAKNTDFGFIFECLPISL